MKYLDKIRKYFAQRNAIKRKERRVLAMLYIADALIDRDPCRGERAFYRACRVYNDIQTPSRKLMVNTICTYLNYKDEGIIVKPPKSPSLKQLLAS